MSTQFAGPVEQVVRHRLAEIRANWVWFLILGVLLVVLGVVLLGSPVVASLATATVIGALLVFGGIVECVGAFWCQRWNGFFGLLLTGILSVVIGMMFLRNPASGLAMLTILIAAFLLVGGIFKLVVAFQSRFEGWVWPALSGVIDFFLGLLIWAGWPASSLVIIGVFVGISLIFRGMNWVMLALALKSRIQKNVGNVSGA